MRKWNTLLFQSGDLLNLWREVTVRLAKNEYCLSYTFQQFQTWYMTVKIHHGNPSISSLSRKLKIHYLNRIFDLFFHMTVSEVLVLWAFSPNKKHTHIKIVILNILRSSSAYSVVLLLEAIGICKGRGVQLTVEPKVLHLTWNCLLQSRHQLLHSN